ncbi:MULTISPECIES: DUF6651 domain-containing protein [Acinetobacter calcoaceticus/baumannii complex]|uniref:DUF6651 domain-containing protein n=1 Tax=Acinetobacter calcoaceticus/baumannii complex TaxID=909768 RepID=UPI0004483E40|nr:MULTISPECIES: DUF6651 domain-containing protein [Acinetobacter calcoaceticus/baumannii complex]HEO1802095.1 hypothetical protein [Acinetobacter baumannii]EXA86117.1 hypothetical protein J508_3341 [Acinetobacter sp. 1289694]KQF58512.1 hypothetical protein APC13_03520 [Acinetobacter pittii]KRI49438.1 hypothetical protein APC42_17720 [Acinetobacter pittii]MBJ9716746.1 hypothetical protein [Acinetobacter pittii]
MKLKTVTIDGKVYAEVDGDKPIYVHDDGKEMPHDAAHSVATISRLNNEAKTNREAKEAAEKALKAFEGIEDPVAAKKAIQTMQNLDDKKLVDAGEVEKVKAEAIKAVEEKYAPIVQQRDALEASLHKELIGGGFARSKYIQDNIAVPVDMVQATFGNHFKIEEGKVVAYDPNGEKIYSRVRPGELANVDEALESLVGGYPHKDLILKGGKGTGGGFQSGGKGGAPAGMKRSEMSVSQRADYIKEHGQESFLKLPN